ncbi:hypothetical protein TWF481_001740 [Arthrobotrys musiformis]|uniref:F-box domain-containing protein n=1 Tax=Arthrobotrys musiformis TaxID=47236 RepID=A0AAV9VU37_9PEZI
MPLSSLPVEILGEILSQIDDRDSLESAIFSCRLFYAAYREQKESIDHAVWINSYSECEVYCKFLTHAILNFLPSSASSGGFQDTVYSKDIIAFFAAYMRWSARSEVPQDSVRDLPPALPEWGRMTAIPNPRRKELTDTHKYILLWTKKFFDDKLIFHPFTLERVTNPTPPSWTERTRVCTAFYQFWIYSVFYHALVVGERSDNTYGFEDGYGEQYMAQLRERLTKYLLGCMEFKEVSIIRFSLVSWMHECVSTDFAESIRRDSTYLDVCTGRGYLGVWDSSFQSRHRDRVGRWSLACNLGPKHYWNFLFKDTHEEQVSISLAVTPREEYEDLCYNFTLDAGERAREGYCPILRICRYRFYLQGGYFSWWIPSQGREDVSVDNTFVIWDDWRLKEWGFKFPILLPPLFFKRLSVGERDTEEAAKERHMKNYGRIEVIVEKTKNYALLNAILDQIREDVLKQALGNNTSG